MTRHIRGAWTKGLLAVLALGILISLGAGQLTGVYRTELTGFVLPATQLVNIDGTIMRLDTRTGAIYRLRGVDNRPGNNPPGASNRRGLIQRPSNWRQRVAPVKESHSGKLQIQEWPLPFDGSVDPKFGVRAWKPDIRAIFLVDIVTGQTWVLQERASTNYAWVAVPDFPS